MNALFENEPAYVLHRRPFKESSLLVDVYTLNHGRLTVVVNGAHKGKSNKAALLQVFQPLHLTWGGRSDLKTLRHAEAPSQAFQLKGAALYCGYYLNELLLYLSPVMECSPELFSYYGASLARLADNTNLMQVTRQFEWQLLNTLGLGPDLSADVQGHPIQANRHYRLTSELQLQAYQIGSTSVHTPNTPNSHGASISGEALLALFDLLDIDLDLGGASAFDKAISQEHKHFTRTLIDHCLHGRPLKSREMLMQWYRLRHQP